MTDCRQLLADYAENGSETAFRELVSRYIDLVYSTACRFLNGDAHLTEDVTQTAFADLAVKAPTLSKEILLGGWCRNRSHPHQHYDHDQTQSSRPWRPRYWRGDYRRPAKKEALSDNEVGLTLFVDGLFANERTP